jgi:histidine kinase
VQHVVEEMKGAYLGQRIDLAGPGDVLALADPDRTTQILTNLIDNAAKYSPEGSPIGVAWWHDQGAAMLQVRDAGCGIPDEGRAQLFTRFGRLPGSRVRAGHVGTGLGLFIGRQLARAMGGDLDLACTGPAGSTFRLRLPGVTAEAMPASRGRVRDVSV